MSALKTPPAFNRLTLDDRFKSISLRLWSISSAVQSRLQSDRTGIRQTESIFACGASAHVRRCLRVDRPRR